MYRCTLLCKQCTTVPGNCRQEPRKPKNSLEGVSVINRYYVPMTNCLVSFSDTTTTVLYLSICTTVQYLLCSTPFLHTNLHTHIIIHIFLTRKYGNEIPRDKNKMYLNKNVHSILRKFLRDLSEFSGKPEVRYECNGLPV